MTIDDHFLMTSHFTGVCERSKRKGPPPR